ncbi:unknown [Clostridium sp. CAG:594]|nr:unknown [Clostridium sp. CAG:594]
MNQSLSSNPECEPFDLVKNDNVDIYDKGKYLQLFNYNIYYVDSEKKLASKDTLNAGETKHMKLVIEYKDTATELPENNITLTSSDPITITYEQKD